MNIFIVQYFIIACMLYFASAAFSPDDIKRYCIRRCQRLPAKYQGCLQQCKSILTSELARQH